MSSKPRNKNSYEQIIESAAERLAAILIQQVETNKINRPSLKSRSNIKIDPEGKEVKRHEKRRNNKTLE